MAVSRALSNERRSPLVAPLLALYLATAVALAYQRTALSPENNFAIFRWSFRHLIAGQDLYAAYPGQHGDFFKYSPTFALLFAPFSLVPPFPGYALWAITCVLALYAGVMRLLPRRQAVTVLLVAYLSVVGDVQRAQSNTLCAGLIVLAWVGYEEARPWGAAASIAAGTLVKLFPLGAVAGALLHPRKLRFALILSIALAVGVLLPLVAVSPHALASQYRSWLVIEFGDLAPAAPPGSSATGLYSGVMGMLRAWTGLTWPYWPTQIAGTVLLLTPLAVRRRSGWGDRLFRLQFLASLLIFCVLFNHQTESPTFVIAMVGTALWFAVSERARWRAALMAASVIIVNLGSTVLMGSAWYHDYYVRYVLKTVPMLIVWIVIQGELLGLVANHGGGEIARAPAPAS